MKSQRWKLARALRVGGGGNVGEDRLIIDQVVTRTQTVNMGDTAAVKVFMVLMAAMVTTYTTTLPPPEYFHNASILHILHCTLVYSDCT